MGTKILLDTDIGSDIDDAVCLAYLLAQPDCDLVGITTVSGEAIKRAQMASSLCKVAGKSVPIFPGVERPLLNDALQREASQAVALEKWDHETSFPEGQAIPFMQDLIRSNPGEITLLTIGCLTNAALLFARQGQLPDIRIFSAFVKHIRPHFLYKWPGSTCRLTNPAYQINLP